MTPADQRNWVLHPWLISAYPVVFLYAQNLDYVELPSALRVLPGPLVAATLLFIGLRLALGGALRAGLLTTILVALFFGYGPAYEYAAGIGLGPGVLLTLWAVLAVTAAVVVAKSRPSPSFNRGLNVVAAVLLAMPLIQIGRAHLGDASASDDPDRRVAASPAGDERPERDLYYIILDEYQRQDRLLAEYGFDNSPFIDALAERGFYVADRARSNYTKTILSLAATFNMTYLDQALSRPGRLITRLRRMVESHEVGETLRAHGYTYVHVSSGKHPTATNEIADVVVDFAPSGELWLDARTGERTEVEHDRREFTRLVIGMTLAGHLIRPESQEALVRGRDVPYVWYAPERTLASFAAVARIPEMEEPTFTLFHVIKPHAPYMFDRDGGVLEKPAGWSWKDGREDSAAMLEQLLFLNRLVLDLIDEILARSETTPIIVIQGDHGENLFAEPLGERLKVLSAFLLPAGGQERLYPSISNVNTFRLLLSHYFGHDLEFLPDRGIVSEGSELVEVEGETLPSAGAAP